MNTHYTISYKNVNYDVTLNTQTDDLFVNGQYLCPFQYNGIDWESEQHLIDSITDCIGGWVEGYEIYSLEANNKI